MIQFLSLDEVLESHSDQIANYGGSEGIRDVGLLESALAQPAAMFDGRYLLATFSRWPQRICFIL